MSTPVDHLRAVTAHTDLHDLRAMVEEAGPFLTVHLPTPHALVDAGERLRVEWRTARSAVAERWPAERLAALDGVVDGLPHDGGEALAIVQSAGGRVLVEALGAPVPAVATFVEPLPRLAAVVESRQRSLPYVLVATDRTGADISAFDGGALLRHDVVEGTTEHIRRGHFGGWSNPRFQQRAENRWEQNAHDVAAAVVHMAEQVHPVVVAVAGEVRAQSLVVEALDAELGERVVRLEAGDARGIAAEVERTLADRVARAEREAVEQVRAGVASGQACTFEATPTALGEGRVGTLLVHDDGEGSEGAPLGRLERPAGTRLVDAAVAAALRTGADVLVVPKFASMGGPLAALLRW